MMTGADAQGFAAAFAQFTDTIFKIVNTSGGMLVILVLFIVGLSFYVWRLRGKLEAMFSEKLTDLGERLTQCETRHKEGVQREDACLRREKKNLLAIATLHGILKGIESKISANVDIPSLDELFDEHGKDEDAASVSGAAEAQAKG